MSSMLVISHGHPHIQGGGGEIAAYSCYQGYVASGGFSRVTFLASTWGRTGTLRRYAENEYLWDQETENAFSLSVLHQDSLFHQFVSFVTTLRPDIVHIHHVVHLGLELLRVLKNCLPRVKILYTLHEFLPICPYFGQMRRPDGSLCVRSGIDFCPRCVSGVSAEDMWQRKTRIQHYFSLVDRFISPSHFVRQRYVDWGVAPERIVTLENGLRPVAAVPPRSLCEGERRNRFAFLGQCTPFKGLDFLLETFLRMSPEDRSLIRLEIHTSGLEHQKQTFRDRLVNLRDRAVQTGSLIWRGPYHCEEVSTRISGADYIVVPSLWWENSPVVIQEAFAVGRPVLVSNIGGMAEKVTHGVNGLHVPVGDTLAWADTLLRVSKDTALFDTLCAGIRQPVDMATATQQHLALIRELWEK